MNDEFCSQHYDNCGFFGTGASDRFKLIEKESAEYHQVKKLLKSGWKHRKKNTPVVHAIYKVMWPLHMLDPYLKYRKIVQTTLEVENLTVQRPGNEQLLFHGTNRACQLGENPEKISLCGEDQCSLCTIIRSSFDIKECGSKHSFTRFGKAIYTTSCSSKADDYSVNLHTDATKRVLLLNRVVVGKGFRTPLNSTHLRAPPGDHHSVIGIPGVHLNYEETVVYRNDAVIPAYMILYELEPRIPWKSLVPQLFNVPLAV